MIFNNDVAEEIQLSISDQLNREIYQSNLHVNSGANGLELNVASWEPGIYFAHLRKGGKSHYQKFVVIK